MNWYVKSNFNINEVQIVSPEYEDSDNLQEDPADAAWQLAQNSSIRILRDKELSAVALLNDKTIGGLWTSWTGDGEFSFDVVVHPQYQRRGIGEKLIDNAFSQFSWESEAYQNPQMVIDVVNPRLISLLERKGLKIQRVDGGHTIMVRDSDLVHTAQKQPMPPGGAWNLQPSLQNVDWEKAKQPITKTKSDSFEDQLAGSSGLFEIREAAKIWGYYVKVIHFFKAEPIAVLSNLSNNELLVIDDFAYPALTIKEANEWINDLSDSDFDFYIDFPSKNEVFWESVSDNYTLYHGTNKQNVSDIMKHGLKPRSQSRGLSNRGDGPGVYTSAEYETAAYYYDVVIEIDVGGMKNDGYTPSVRSEGPVEEAEKRSAIAWKIGLKDYRFDVEEGIAEDTIVFEDVIPPKYLKVV